MKCIKCEEETMGIYCFFCYCEVTKGGTVDPPIGWKAAREKSELINGSTQSPSRS